LTKPNQSKWGQRPGNVHYNELGTTAQGDKVASTILKTLENNEKNEQKNAPDKK